MSKIEWTDETWNPTVGCDKVSAGCKNCYAEVMANRLKAMGVNKYEFGFKFGTHADSLNKPELRNKPTIYFVNSMSDLFHEKMEEDNFEYLDRIFTVMYYESQHQYQILTKRDDIMLKYYERRLKKGRKMPKKVWLGVSIENNDPKVLKRIDSLRKVKTNRFLSIEPLLDDVSDNLNLEGIHWVIVGGESGHKARPMKKEWVIKIKDKCIKENIPFFFKQWGAYGEDGKRRSKKANGNLLDGKEYIANPMKKKKSRTII